MNSSLLAIEKSLTNEFNQIDDICLINSKKVLDAFHAAGVCEGAFNGTTGYGYNDLGRDIIEKVYANYFKAEKALVRNQFISGTHALTKTLFGLLRPHDLLLSISGTPYDTLHEVIGINDNPSSLKSYLVDYDEIALVDNDFDDDKIVNYLKEHQVKLIEIQRSCGYSTRESITIDKVKRIIKKIKEVSPNTLVMVDNCYCEMVSDQEPIEVGADVCVGSLIKNLGAGICSNGAYVVGKEKCIDLIAESLNSPGEGYDVGPSLGANKSILEGFYMAPMVVKNALKVGTLLSAAFKDLGYDATPLFDNRADIVTKITLNDPDKVVKFCEIVQANSAVDANVKPIPSPMPGYEDLVVMASGSFTQGSSIEISCDGPLREPYIAYFQGSLTYEYGKICINELYEAFKND